MQLDEWIKQRPALTVSGGGALTDLRVTCKYTGKTFDSQGRNEKHAGIWF